MRQEAESVSYFVSIFIFSDENVALSDCVRNFFLLDDNLLLKHLHGVNSSCVLLSDLVDLSECSLSNELQDLEIIWTVVLLLSSLEGDFDINLSRETRVSVISTSKWKPSFDWRVVVLGQVRFQVNMAQKLLCGTASIVNSEIYSRI